MRTRISVGRRAEVLRCQASVSVAPDGDGGALVNGQCEHPAKGEAPMYFAADRTSGTLYPACGVHVRMAAQGKRTVWRAA